MEKMVMNGMEVKILKGAVVYVKALFQDSPGENERF
jgi:hypothetical protein